MSATLWRRLSGHQVRLGRLKAMIGTTASQIERHLLDRQLSPSRPVCAYTVQIDGGMKKQDMRTDASHAPLDGASPAILADELSYQVELPLLPPTRR